MEVMSVRSTLGLGLSADLELTRRKRMSEGGLVFEQGGVFIRPGGFLCSGKGPIWYSGILPTFTLLSILSVVSISIAVINDRRR